MEKMSRYTSIIRQLWYTFFISNSIIYLYPIQWMIIQGKYVENELIIFSTCTVIDRFHKSHDASVPYPTIHHLGTEMCIFLFQCGVLWHMEQVHCGICEIGPFHENIFVALYFLPHHWMFHVKQRSPLRCDIVLITCICMCSHIYIFCPRGLFQYKDHFSRYKHSHYKDKTVIRLSYLYNGNSYTDEMLYLYSNGLILFLQYALAYKKLIDWPWP